jgi:hypothetical protein
MRASASAMPFEARCDTHLCLSEGFTLAGFLMDLDCAPTVHESNVFIPFGLLLSEKQIPRFVGNVSS